MRWIERTWKTYDPILQHQIPTRMSPTSFFQQGSYLAQQCGEIMLRYLQDLGTVYDVIAVGAVADISQQAARLGLHRKEGSGVFPPQPGHTDCVAPLVSPHPRCVVAQFLKQPSAGSAATTTARDPHPARIPPAGPHHCVPDQTPASTRNQTPASAALRSHGTPARSSADGGRVPRSWATWQSCREIRIPDRNWQAAAVSISLQGDVEFEFPSTDNAAFYRIEVD